MLTDARRFHAVYASILPSKARQITFLPAVAELSCDPMLTLCRVSGRAYRQLLTTLGCAYSCGHRPLARSLHRPLPQHTFWCVLPSTQPCTAWHAPLVRWALASFRTGLNLRLLQRLALVCIKVTRTNALALLHQVCFVPYKAVSTIGRFQSPCHNTHYAK